jgi:hypothetical protein
MRQVEQTPSLVPDHDGTVYVVLDDFGAAGRIYRETDEEQAKLDDVVDNLLTGQYNRPVRVVAFNIAEGWSWDASEDAAWFLLRRIASEGRAIPDVARAFVEFHVGEDETLRAEARIT